MEGTSPVAVLRLGHRPGRDERTTTHVGLTARALGADRVILAGPAASRRETIESVVTRFGGHFDVESTDTPEAALNEWDGAIVHLTMYGLPIDDELTAIRDRHTGDTPLLIVVGAGKVPGSVFGHADWNVAVTNQPHSEIAALAIFLDRLFCGRELDRSWPEAERTVVPQKAGKEIERR
ncbi:MAG: tRNA (cytidine(56)-2'-O)-methyltransferase [Salinirussus sp.]